MKIQLFISLSLIPLLLITIPCPTFASVQRTDTVDRGAQDPAVSPDGSQIAVGIFGKIWLVPIGGGQARQVTYGPSWDSHPAWSPDGQFLAYAHQRPGRTELLVHNLATGGSITIYSTEQTIGQIAYAPRGGEIFFLHDRNQHEAHLWRVPIGGGEAKQLTFTEDWHEWSFAFSPDGSEVLLNHGRYGSSDLYRLGIDSLEVTRLTNTPADEFSVAWSADGESIVFIERDNGMDRVMVQPITGGPARRVFSSIYDQKQLVLHPDGTAILCAGRRLYRLDLHSGDIAPIPFEAQFVLPDLAEPSLVITNARLFDGTGSDVVENATIEIRDGRIVSVRSEQASAALPADLPVLDAAGRMVLPGLMDNHYHYWHHWTFVGARLLARGVTAVRDPGAAISESMNFKEAIALGILEGPDIYTLGPLIDGRRGYHPMVDVALTSAEAAPALVRALKVQGVDAIKVYNFLTPDVLRAVVAEARAQGLPVTGDIRMRTRWSEAITAGINGFNHMMNGRGDFLPSDVQTYRQDETTEMTLFRARQTRGYWRDIDPESPEVEALIRRMADHNVALDATLVISRVPDERRSSLSLDEFDSQRKGFERMKQFVRRAYEMGVLLLAGTDNGNLFTEMELYAEAGVPNAAVLQAATINGAKWLGRDADFGTVEVGKRAHLILVEGDPLKEMKDIRNISVVIKDGRIVFRK